MLIKELIQNVKADIICGDTEKNVKGLTIDSRKVQDGYLFACINGFTVDGHKFAKMAEEKGASVILCEKDIEGIDESVTVIKTENVRKALSLISMNFYGKPMEKFRTFGITGTNGKTSSTYFMESILREVGRKTGVIGTIEIRIGGEKVDFDFATSTTPDSIELNELFAKMAEEKVDDVIMEVSSHSLELDKVYGCKFDTAIFTNLTQDHLDLHKTMDNYCAAKAKLFKMCKRGIINIDDKYSKKIIDEAECDVKTFGIENECDYKAENIEFYTDRVKFEVMIKGEKVGFELMIPGKFSVYNALGVIAACAEAGIESKTIQKGIANIKGVPGRIQNVPNDKGFNVIVDYAHSPDGLENIIKAVREFTKGRVITVFGCGGDRDKKKRPIMGEISAKLSDYTIVTNDNPRTEEPLDILRDIEAGIKDVTDKYEMIDDRKKAIFKAIEIAERNDSVIIAGKGHENYEIFKDRTIHFDDTEVAAEALKNVKEKK
ncbi:MAG: UDP-N-acetylmuramoyl-L-alanyl-D-glutamate--2,6-diaminopimelate ligase [Firmicutes bacterium]|nr:UDP-N-acetylmuramoyl-L-alanyl-D-glutamate--2,6-diaminopimelate ligase [Bacillota bacterium]